jgi:putative DNA primase/helicase
MSGETVRYSRKRQPADEPAAIRGDILPLDVPLDPKDPMAIARKVIADRYQNGARTTILTWREDLHRYTGSHYAVFEESAAHAEQWLYLESATRRTGKGTAPFQPTITIIHNVVAALRGATRIDSDIAAPAWLDGRSTPSPNELIACTNGLLHFPTREIYPHTPAFFTTHALPFAYDPMAGEPSSWLEFLASLWPDDADAIAALQEIFGYIISGDRRQQKMFLLVGPKRAGKDTIANILQALIGPQGVAGPTLSSLAGPFGLQAMIGKPLAVISDARLSGRTDQAVIAERLLSVTGGGTLTVDRKHKDGWTGKLPTRFLILTNELPRIEDASGALASRFIVLTLTRSWYGQEDTTLFDRLVVELPAILSWSLDGLDRLWERGRFSEPKSSGAAVRQLEDLGSPIKQFVRESCTIEIGAEVDTQILYRHWDRWCQTKNTKPGTEQVFGKNLRAAFPRFETASRRTNGTRHRVYVGLLLAEDELAL